MEEEIFENWCQNATSHEELINCYGHNESLINETTLVDQHNVDMANAVNLERHIKYYCEGVLLLPVAIVGLFGKYV